MFRRKDLFVRVCVCVWWGGRHRKAPCSAADGSQAAHVDTFLDVRGGETVLDSMSIMIPGRGYSVDVPSRTV